MAEPLIPLADILAKAAGGKRLTVNEAVAVAAVRGLTFEAFDVALWPFRADPLRLKRQFR